MSSTILPALASGRRRSNLWDVAAFLCVFGALVAVAQVARGTLAPIAAPGTVTVHLDPAWLPAYAVRTTLRMFAALIASLIFTFTYATAAAKSRRAGLILIPILDILQSVPILGFLSFTVVFFMNLFPGRVMGLELAAIFAVFTSQAWNMAFSFYQALTTLPADLAEAADSFRLTGWQRFWRLEVPFAMPGLVWNTMLSMSGGWFFVVAAEAISVGDHTWTLPGIGSYVALALERRDLAAVAWAILAMLGVILAYDQLLFRPLVAWSAKFRFETTAAVSAEDPWVLKLMRRTILLDRIGDAVGALAAAIGGLPLALPARRRARARNRVPSRAMDALWLALLAAALGVAAWRILRFMGPVLSAGEVGRAVLLGGYTLARVAAVMAIATTIWVPVGVWVGLRPAWARRVQPLAQFLAAFPANLLFPVVVWMIVRYQLNADIFLTPLMLLGTQWYVLFNVVAGAAAFPGDLREVAANFRLRGWLWWWRVSLPGVFPYLVTGLITASGAAWNAAIVSEVASWGPTQLTAHGLGAYIAEATARGDMPRVMLGIVVMSAFVVGFNRLLWRRLHEYATRRMTY